MAASLLIFQYVGVQFSYDNFHHDGERIYRVQQNRYNEGELSTQWAAGCAGIGPDLKATFPEVEEFVKMHDSNTVLARGEASFREKNIFYASESFFNFFGVELLQGNAEEVLTRPFTLALSQSAARRYFGDEDPVGKTLTQNGRSEYEVTGVYEDFPSNSHMNPDILLSFETYVEFTNEGARTSWEWDGFYTYIKLTPGSSPEVLKEKLPPFIEEKFAESIEQFNANIDFNFQPIANIHLDSDFMYEFKANGDRQTANFLGLIGAFILVLAWVNYINLSTSKSLDRAREIGIRKVMGSYRGQLIGQFLLESIFLNMISVVMAFLLVAVLLPQFNAIAGASITIAAIVTDLSLVLPFGLAILLGALLAGLYPAFVLSGFRPVSVLKGKLATSAKGNSLRKGLVVAQFLITMVLMIGTYTVYQQMQYMNAQDLGVNIEQTLVVMGPRVTDSTYTNQLEAFNVELEREADIESVTASTAVPGSQPDWNAGGIRLLSQDAGQSKQFRIVGVDYDYVESFDLAMAEGRNFSIDVSTDRGAVLFNEAAANHIGFNNIEEIINKEIHFWGDTFKVVGVLKNFHQESLKTNHEPLIFRLIPGASNYYSVKVNTDDLAATIEKVGDAYQGFFPGNPFDYFFLDDHFNQQYQADAQFGRVFGIFAGLALFIGCLGLFGLSTFTAVQRTKEIGIRKVMGASVNSILTLLSTDFSKLVIIAMLIAAPAAWFVMDNWLSSFAYRIDLSWWIFVVPGLVVFVIALLTVSFQTLKAAIANPIRALRHE